MALASKEQELISEYADESRAYYLQRVAYNRSNCWPEGPQEIIYMAREGRCTCRCTERQVLVTLLVQKDLTPDVDRIQDVGGKEWYRLDSAA